MKLFQVFSEILGRKSDAGDEEIRGHIETVKAKLDWTFPTEPPASGTTAQAPPAKAKADEVAH